MEDLTSPQGSVEEIEVGNDESSTSPQGSVEEIELGNGDSVTIEINDLDRNHAISIRERLHIELGRINESSTMFSCSIFRVPDFLRQYNQKLYDPQVISIGPFHYEKRKGQLGAMEEHKWRYLRDIISRNGDGSLERYVAVLNKLEEKARKCYSEVIPLDSKSFVEMMLLDACFIIEFSRKDSMKREEDVLEDGIFQLEWLMTAIRDDLMMPENQIPFFILHHLLDLIRCRQHSLLQISTFLFGGSIFNERLEHSSDIQIQHLLHLTYIYFNVLTEEKSSNPTNLQKIPCASKLKEAGIKFSKEGSDQHRSFLDIRFHKGVIDIPRTRFSGRLNRWFLYLITFEQCYCPCKNHITAYITFMNSLIRTGKDVEILCREGIIENWVSSDGDKVSLFNNMERELIVREEDFYLSRICEEINQYCEGTWPKMRATLVHDYFRNRWAIISFFAALFLLLLTLTQTFFSSFPKLAYGG